MQGATRHASVFREFIDSGAAGGIVLMVAAALALIVANSPLAPAYFGALATYLGPLNVEHWINDGLMAVFFLLVGLEIKREFLDGQLSTWSRRVLPGLGAAGGMVVPALIYVVINSGNPDVLARLGGSHRHRHRFCARRPVAAGKSRTGLHEGLPDRAGDHRRPRGGSYHCDFLHRQSVPALSGLRGRCSLRFDRAQPHERAYACALCGARRGAVVSRVKIRGARNCRRRGAGADDSAARLSGHRARPRSFSAAPAGARAARRGGVWHRANLRFRQCRRVAGRNGACDAGPAADAGHCARSVWRQARRRLRYDPACHPPSTGRRACQCADRLIYWACLSCAVLVSR